MMRLAWLPLLLLVACADTEDDRLDAQTAPRGAAFRPVAQVLVARCASLDCHGSRYRNMRLFGLGSGRLDPEGRPDAPETTDAEVEASYQAVVALEPAKLRQVIAEGGKDPERLTFFRKGQELEAHKGGRSIVPGDTADVCIRSWLAGSTDAAACTAAVPRLGDP